MQFWIRFLDIMFRVIMINNQDGHDSIKDNSSIRYLDIKLLLKNTHYLHSQVPPVDCVMQVKINKVQVPTPIIQELVLTVINESKIDYLNKLTYEPMCFSNSMSRRKHSKPESTRLFITELNRLILWAL
uniref:Uncharacterized protein n=2 Tax=Cacopsylla melanoneura TaxID=428564 RepID=A0A8D8TRB2_9HEMI